MDVPGLLKKAVYVLMVPDTMVFLFGGVMGLVASLFHPDDLSQALALGAICLALILGAIWLLADIAQTLREAK